MVIGELGAERVSVIFDEIRRLIQREQNGNELFRGIIELSAIFQDLYQLREPVRITQ